MEHIFHKIILNIDFICLYYNRKGNNSTLNSAAFYMLGACGINEENVEMKGVNK